MARMLHTAPLTLDEREAILVAALPRYLAAGWRVTVQTLTTAQLERPRQFDSFTAFAAVLLCGIGLLVYLGSHFAQGPEAVYLVVEEDGSLREIATRAR